MSNKEAFIKLMDSIISSGLELKEYTEDEKKLEMALNYFKGLKEGKGDKMPVEITENGIKILKYMQENETTYNNIFTSKTIAEGLFVQSRSVAGSMKKLITDGYVTKLGGNPISYAITDKGREKQLSVDE